VTTYRAAVYLQIPAEYCRFFGGLRWAHYGEAVEFLEGPAAGNTFAFAREIALFLEGLESAGGPLLDFGLVLHLLYLIGLGDRASDNGPGRCIERIAAPFRALGCPLRNAGALCAWLARGVTGSAGTPSLELVRELLEGGSWIPQMVISHPYLGSRDQANQPGLEPAQFERHIERALEPLSDQGIRHWLRHGQGPLEAADERFIPRRPRRLETLLNELEERPRLAGIARLVRRLDGALSLPPSRRTKGEVECGGYADVATRGSLEQILPIQLALESEEFLRRFAEQELLYLHREEPRQPPTEQLVLLLDQGVRTWGEVRLLLAGAALALARQALRTQIDVILAATSSSGTPVDPTQIDPDAFCALLEASDLSPHPADALANLLSAPAVGNRDLVLLTHARSLAEPAVAAAARLNRSDRSSRLFAVSVDVERRVELAELVNGLPVILSRCRVHASDYAQPAPAPVSGARRPAWRGHVEPIGFPFCCGVLERIENRSAPGALTVDFDEEGVRVLFIGRHGLISTWRIDGTDAEILPRPLVNVRSAPASQSVIGVAGGFVLVGQHRERLVLAHYDFTSRTCAVHTLDAWAGLTAWIYFRDLHTLVGRGPKATDSTLAVDLAETGDGATRTPRAIRALMRAGAGGPPGALTESQSGRSDLGGDATRNCGWEFDSASGTLRHRSGSADVTLLTPLSDGRPALKGGRIVFDRQAGDVLAILVEGAVMPGLYFISLTGATVLGVLPLHEPLTAKVFALSRDGHRFAYFPDAHQLEVRDVAGVRPPVLVTSQEDVWVHFTTLGRSCLLVREFELTGPRRVKSSCLIRWDQTRLEVAYHDPEMLLARLGGVIAESRSLPPRDLGLPPGWTPIRFVQVLEHSPLVILIDRYNHIAVCRENTELVCMFYVNRGQVAAWLPDGICWGSRRLIGGEPSPGAAERIAAALRSAERGERVSL
jgi:hypothetical protein